MKIFWNTYKSSFLMSFINCSVCSKKTVAFRGSIAFKTGLCMPCWEQQYRVKWVSPEGHTTSMSKEEYLRKKSKYDEQYKNYTRVR